MKRKTAPVLKPVANTREPTTKQKLKRKAKSFVEGITRLCFGYRCKSVIIRNRPRKAEMAYKIRILGKNSTEALSRFNSEIQRLSEGHYNLNFSGSINPRTSREELFIDLVLFGDVVEKPRYPENNHGKYLDEDDDEDAYLAVASGY